MQSDLLRQRRIKLIISTLRKRLEWAEEEFCNLDYVTPMTRAAIRHYSQLLEKELNNNVTIC